MSGEAMNLAEKVRANADLVVKQLSGPAGRQLGFDEDSVAWVDGFIERQRGREGATPESSEGLVGPLGSFLGECMCRELGGEWAEVDGEMLVRFGEGNEAFPFNKVRKQFANGPADSILSFYQSAAALFRPA